MACASAMSIDGSVHVPTMIAGCARMSGSYLLRSLGLELSRVGPGHVVLSEEASLRTPALIKYCAVVLAGFGTAISDSPPEALGGQVSQLTQGFLEAQALLEPHFAPLKERHSLDHGQMAKAAAVATAALIHQFSKHLDPNTGFGFAAYGFTEGARTAPARAAAGPV